MYRANLSYEMLVRYLTILCEHGLVERSAVHGYYRTTVRGQSFVRDYEEFKRLAQLYQSKESALRAVGELKTTMSSGNLGAPRSLELLVTR